MKKNILFKKVPWYKTFVFSISLWFVPLAIIPVLLISYDHYIESVKFIKASSYHDIKQSSILERKFITNWFDSRINDMKSWSNTDSYTDFLEYLNYEFESENTTLQEYITSDIYLFSSTIMENNMIQLVKTYDYLYDVFLIDKKGNILYTVEKEEDLGTNLLDGKYSTTKFASAFKLTLKDSKIHFSDLELYQPSHGIVAGFLTAPVFDDDKNLIGVFAIQIKLNKIYNLFHDKEIAGTEFNNYLVGEDGLLRSTIHNSSELLKLKVDSKQFQLWSSEDGIYSKHEYHKDKDIFIYRDPFGEDVFGLHQNIDILGVKWALISEAKLDSINKLMQSAINRALIYIFVVTFLVIIISIIISNLLVKPILLLSEAIRRFAYGEREIKVDIHSKNEIEILANSFKEMMFYIKEGEDELDEQKYALNAHAIVSVTDITGMITYVNDKFITISGYSREELVGKNHKLFNSGEKSNNYWKDMYETISSGAIWQDDIKNITKNGDCYWVDTTIVPFRDKNNKPTSYIAIRTDITQKKRYEEELLKAKGVAEDSVKLKSEFFASMSHEIRTPMNGVIGMLGLLLNTKLNDSQHHKAYLAQTSAKALLNLINDILDFSKVEAGKLKLENREFNIQNDLGDFAEAIAFKAQEKGIEVILDLKDVDVMFIRADSERIRQILNNLVSNAIKFTDKGFILIKVRLEKGEGDDARLYMSVKDSGIGIPQNKIEKLFDSFSQVDASTTRKYGGTGLGLAIVKKLSTLMDGKVELHSVEGIGSEFNVDIAIKLVTNSQTVEPEVNVENKRVLILDQCNLCATTLKKQLEFWGMNVIIENNSQKLLENYNENYDLAFIEKDEYTSDLGLKIKSHNPKIKLILVTSLKDSTNVSAYLDSSFDMYYPKPATTEDILNSLKTLSTENPLVSHIEKSTMNNDFIWKEDVKILLVDDNKVNLLVASGILEEMDLEADIANNGLEAVNAVQEAIENQYDIILMDCQMPEMDGYEATRIIKSEIKDIPIIAMTANAMEGDKEKCIASGMDEYLSKPIDSEALKNLLRKYISV